MLIGQGIDIHRFEAGRPLVLGGVRVKHDEGLAAHSDGDVAIHALCDALRSTKCICTSKSHHKRSIGGFVANPQNGALLDLAPISLVRPINNLQPMWC